MPDTGFRQQAPYGFLPRIGVAEGVRRHKLLAIAPVILLVGVALAYGLQTTPTYTAEARQMIGRIDVSEPGALSGFQEATSVFATSYSRAISATPVVERVARRTGLSPDAVRGRLTAYPIPQSAVFVVSATGPSEESAVEVTVEGTRALQAYIEETNAENPNGDRLFREFREAALRQAELRDEFSRARQSLGAAPTLEERREVAEIKSRLDAAALEVAVTSSNYGDSQRSQSMVSIVQDLTLPETATNNRFERLQLLLFIAVSVGVLLGLALATLRSNQEVRRALSVR